MTYQGAIDELKSLENNESMPDWFKPTLKKVRETMEMDGRENVEGEWIPVSVIEDIKAEIDEQYDRVRPYNIDVAQGLEMALDILDRIGKAESEDKE